MFKYAEIADIVYFWFAANTTAGAAGDGATPIYVVRLAGAAADAAKKAGGTPTLLTHADYSDGSYEIAIDTTGWAAGEYAVFCSLLISTVNPNGFVGSFKLRTAGTGALKVDAVTIPAATLAASQHVIVDSGSVTVSDKTGFSLSAAGILAIWDYLLSGFTGAIASIGNLFKTNIDATISSRTKPADTQARVALVDVCTANTDMVAAPPSADIIAVAVEQHIINETDGEQVLKAITDKIAAVDPSLGDLSLSAIASAVRTELSVELARIDAAITTRLAAAGITITSGKVDVNDKTGFALTSAYDAAKTAPPTAIAIRTEMDSNSTKLAHLDANITTRSSHSAADVWAVSVRTLSSFGTLVADIAAGVWGASVRTLSSIADSAGVTTLLERITGAVALAATALSNAIWTDAKAVFIDKKISESGGGTPPTVEEIQEGLATTQNITDAVTAIEGAMGDVADPWIVELPGSYPPGSAGKIIGSYLPGAGSGSVNYIYTLTDAETGVPIPGADIRVSTDIAGTIIIASSATNTYGEVTFLLDPGTYYFWREKTGWTFTNPDTEIVT